MAGISAWIGKPGHGKSYNVVRKVVLPALAQGRTLVTNLPLDVALLERDIPASGGRIQLVTHAEIQTPGWAAASPPGALYVVDEAWRIWPSTGRVLDPAWGSWFAEHRHRVGEDGRSQEIVIVTQDVNQLSSGVRRLIEATYICVQLAGVGQRGKFRIDTFQGCVPLDAPSSVKAITQEFGAYKPEVYRYYKSHTQSETGGAGNEERVHDGANALRSWTVRLGFPVGLLLLAAAGFGFWKIADPEFWTSDAQAERKRAAAARVEANVKAIRHEVAAYESFQDLPIGPAAPVPDVPPISKADEPVQVQRQVCGLPASELLRLVGVMRGPDLDVVAVYDRMADTVFPVTRRSCGGEDRDLCCRVDGFGVAWSTGQPEQTNVYRSEDTVRSESIPSASASEIRARPEGGSGGVVVREGG